MLLKVKNSFEDMSGDRDPASIFRSAAVPGKTSSSEIFEVAKSRRLDENNMKLRGRI